MNPLFLPKRRPDCFQNTRGILKHVVIPEPDDPVPEFFQHGRTLRVGVNLVRMLPAVHLDYQFPGDASEIGHIGADGYLSAKMMAAKLVSAQSTPES